ncbi:hypothetical protein EDC04DRAFT_2893736 [Pisolithus marmoratus]|nr:hypothetical protein EDC04DRAFT_2893736 [Pisolithus marmoratus]
MSSHVLFTLFVIIILLTLLRYEPSQTIPWEPKTFHKEWDPGRRSSKRLKRGSPFSKLQQLALLLATAYTSFTQPARINMSSNQCSCNAK